MSILNYDDIFNKVNLYNSNTNEKINIFHSPDVNQNKKLSDEEINKYLIECIYQFENNIYNDNKYKEIFTFLRFHDDIFSNQRIYYFKYNYTNKEIAIRTNIPSHKPSTQDYYDFIDKLENNEIDENYQSKLFKYCGSYDLLKYNQRVYWFEYCGITTTIKKEILNINNKHQKTINIFQLLINYVFPKCTYCNKRYIRYLFKIHYNENHICNKCSWIYEINSIEKFNIVNEIRNNVKNNLNLNSMLINNKKSQRNGE